MNIKKQRSHNESPLILTIDQLRDKVANSSILIFALIGVLGYFFIVLRAKTYGIDTTFIIQSLLAFSLFILAFFRKKLSLNFKVIGISLIVFGVFVIGMYKFGFLATAKVMVIAIPVFLSFMLSFRKTVASLFIIMACYIAFGVLSISGLHSVNIDPDKYISSGVVWAMDGTMLFLTAFGLFYVGRLFSQTIQNNSNIIEQVNFKMQKREDQLVESEEKYRKLVESFPDIILLSDLKGVIKFGNENLHRITGITKADYANLNRKAHIHPDDLHLVSTEFNKLLRGDVYESALIENRFVDADGKVHWFSGTMSKLSLNGETLIQTVSRDITEKKAIEIELKKHRDNLAKLVEERTLELNELNKNLEKKVSDRTKELQHKNKKLQSYAFFNAHQLRGPFCRIKGLLLLLDMDDPPPDIRTEISERLLKSMEELEQVISEIQIAVKDE